VMRRACWSGYDVVAFFAEHELPRVIDTSGSAPTEAHVRAHASTRPANRVRLSTIATGTNLTFEDSHPGIAVRVVSPTGDTA
jgi:hypothetical protein